MELDFEFFGDAEIIHFYNSETNDKIVQYGNQFKFNINGYKGEFDIPLIGKMRFLVRSRLGRRLARLDKGTCVYLPCFSKIIVIYQYAIYTYDISLNKLNKIKSIPFRNPLFMGTLVLNGSDVYFGEYFNNSEQRKVDLYRSVDGGDNWDVIYTFPKRSIFHIHGVYSDPYTDDIYVCTGDFEGQCKILRADKNFENIEEFGDGSQSWRAVSMFFLEDRIVWGMDSPLDDVHIMCFDRETSSLHKGQPLDGPVWYSKHTSDNFGVLQTSVEYKHLKGVKNASACVYVTKDFDSWSKVAMWEKDIFPHKYFRHGVIMFSEGEQSLDRFALHGEALKNLDGRCGLASISYDDV